MDKPERSLAESVKHAAGRYGGFSFAGDCPEGVTVHRPLPKGSVFPNGATAAVLLTFDVEGTYGNGVGDMGVEIANYGRICRRIADAGITATFHVVGRMAAEHGPRFVRWMLEAGCEVATHGAVHELNELFGGEWIYAGHYGPAENLRIVREGVEALEAIAPGCVRGARLPYAHFNEYSYDAIEALGLAWASHVGIDDMADPARGFGGQPFRMQLGERLYRIVEIPLDTQTFDWAIWMADERANAPVVEAVRRYCASRSIPHRRTPAGGVDVWRGRIEDAIAERGVFTLLCHPINLAVRSDRWGDPVEEFLFPVIDLLAGLSRAGRLWAPTCGQMADFYKEATRWDD